MRVRVYISTYRTPCRCADSVPPAILRLHLFGQLEAAQSCELQAVVAAAVAVVELAYPAPMLRPHHIVVESVTITTCAMKNIDRTILISDLHKYNLLSSVYRLFQVV